MDKKVIYTIGDDEEIDKLVHKCNISHTTKEELWQRYKESLRELTEDWEKLKTALGNKLGEDSSLPILSIDMGKGVIEGS